MTWLCCKGWNLIKNIIKSLSNIQRLRNILQQSTICTILTGGDKKSLNDYAITDYIFLKICLIQ